MPEELAKPRGPYNRQQRRAAGWHRAKKAMMPPPVHPLAPYPGESAEDYRARRNLMKRLRGRR